MAPFIGIRFEGLARVLNRILVLAELAVAPLFCYMYYSDATIPVKKWWIYALIVLTAYFGSRVLNAVLRTVNKVVLVLIYGTSNRDEMQRIADRRKSEDGFACLDEKF